ncbi:unnamed protein product, partial [Symbiodinium sp. KB8]
ARAQEAPAASMLGGSGQDTTFDLQSALADIQGSIEEEDRKDADASRLADPAAGSGPSFNFEELSSAVAGSGAKPTGSQRPGHADTWDFSLLEGEASRLATRAEEEHAAALAAMHASDDVGHLKRAMKRGQAKTRTQNRRAAAANKKGAAVNEKLAAKLKKRSAKESRKKRALRAY